MSPSLSPLISVIVLNFNGEEHLRDCLDSLGCQTCRSLEVLVADNGSSDKSAEIVKQYPVRWEPLERNHGFARGNNLAVARARGEIVVFVNNDMRFDSDFVESLAAPLLTDETVFATDALQLDWAGNVEIHRATRLVRRRLWDGLRRPGLLPLVDIVQQRADGHSDVVQACAGNMAVRRSMFDQLGGFDERLPAGWEDTDICWKAWLKGWRTVFIPEAVCWHKVGGTSGSGEGAIVRYRGSIGGRLVFATRHLPMEYALLAWSLPLLATLRDLALGRWASAGRRARAIREFVRYLPGILRERHHLYAEARRTPRAHLHDLMHIGSRMPARALLADRLCQRQVP
jgi:GT2 family glycosyltransferase